MKILLIRNNEYSGTEIKTAILNLGFTIYDVTKPEQISISEINNQGKCDIEFFKIPIHKFERIYFLNTPFKENNSTNYKDNIFEYCELDASIISALQYNSGKIINAGLISISRSILNKYFFVFLFKKIGWELHNSIFNGPNFLSQKKEHQINILISRTNFSFYPYYDVYFKDYTKIQELIFNTQKVMWEKKIDILNVSCKIQNESISIVNISQYFQGIGNELLSKSLKEIL